MRITSGGNVGIGTTSPSYPLDVVGNARMGATLYIGTRVQGLTGGSYSNLILNDLGGNVGIGTTRPTTKLNVSGNIAVNSGSYLSFIDSNLSYNKIGRNTSVGGIQITTGASATMNLLDNGNVGIGTTSPGTLGAVAFTNVGLHVYSGNFGRTVTEGATSAEFLLRDAGASANQKIKTIIGDGGKLYFGAVDDNGTQRKHVTIDDSGNVGIGTTNPAGYKLRVEGDMSLAGNKMLDFGSGNARIVNSIYSLKFQNWDGSTVADHMTILGSGNVGIGTTGPTHKLDVSGTGRFTSTVTATNFILSSDERKKTKIKDLSRDNIDISWKSFEMKSDEGEYRVGVIAQELEIKHPEFVNTDNEGFKSVKYIDLLISKIAELEARLEKAGI